MKRAIISALLALTIAIPGAALAGNRGSGNGDHQHGNKKQTKQHCHAHGLVVVAVGCVNVEDVLTDILNGELSVEDVLDLLPL